MAAVTGLPAETPDEAKENITTKREHDLCDLFDILGSLRSILARSTNICVEEKEYGANGYGPKPWTPSIQSDVPSRFDVTMVGRDKSPYIIRKPIYSMKIASIDDILNETYGALLHLLNKPMIFLKEPPTMRMLGDQKCEPEAIGIPTPHFCILALIPTLLITPSIGS
ncbi:unnamed protein product [Arctia plantaginis]|uniref:Uncharacterized protein n=1 Tax=Arctia plantaginis TaxID=874455 RepID=A0A8S1BP18_ARCPL|nr:unnamed protein product [Arctia plantaginis]